MRLKRPGGAAIARLTRAKTLPVALAPVGTGAALAAARADAFSWGWLAVSLVGTAGLFLGAMALNDYYDERSGADGLGRLERSSIVTGSGLIASKEMTPRAVLLVAATAWGIALATGLWLAAARDPLVLVFGAGGALLAHQVVAPPLRYGYRGLGPAGIFATFGPLPVAGSYLVQAGDLPAEAWFASIVPGVFGALVYFHADLLHWRGDRTARKMTPAARLGSQTALVVSGVAGIAAYVCLTVQVALGLFPNLALVALVTAPLMASAWGRAARDPIAQAFLGLLGATLSTSVVVNVIVALALGVA